MKNTYWIWLSSAVSSPWFHLHLQVTTGKEMERLNLHVQLRRERELARIRGMVYLGLGKCLE